MNKKSNIPPYTITQSRRFTRLTASISASIALGLASVSTASAASASWNQAGSGGWSTGTWNPSVPGNTSSGATNTTDVASFLTMPTAASNVSVDSGRTIRGITFSNTNPVTLTGTNSLFLYDGGTIQRTLTGGGYGRIDAPVKLPGSATFTSNSSGSYLRFGNTIAGSANVAHTLTLSGSGFQYFNKLDDVIDDGSGTGTLAITKSGTGMWSLDAANTYTGATTVSGGTLLVNGSLFSGSSVSVASGGSARLGGSGTINGAVTVDGILAPGAYNASNVRLIGTLTVANDVTWNAGEDWQFQLDTASTTCDLLNLTGAGHDFLKGTGTGFNFDFVNSGNVGTYKIVDWAAGTNFSASDFTYVNLASGLTGSFAFNATQLEFTVTAVPEPSSCLLMLGGAAAIMALRRRSRARL